jgi:hypothetical protein
MESRHEIWDELYAIARNSFHDGITGDKLEQLLMQHSSDHAMIFAVIKKMKSDYYEKRRNEGLLIIAVGAVFILAGFIITCFNYHDNKPFSFAMYGLTTIGIGIMFYGLYRIIG